MSKQFLLAVIVALPLVFSTCDNTNPSSSSQKPFFLAFLRASDNYFDLKHNTQITGQNISVDLYSFNSPTVSTLSFKINSKLPDLTYYNASNSSSYFLVGTWSDGIYLTEPISGQKTFSITSDFGSASTQIGVPNPTVITSHHDLDTISPLSSIVVTWNGNADYYGFYASIAETNSSFPYSDYNTTMIYDTIVTGNSFTISLNKITSIANTVYIDITGANGSQPIAGSIGNISGDGKGFVIATNSSGNSKNCSIELRLRGRLSKSLAKSINLNNTRDSVFQQNVLKTISQNHIFH